MKKVFAFLFVLITSTAAFSATVSDVQMIQENSWVYQSIFNLARENKHPSLVKTTPLSVGELKKLLSAVDYEELSPAGKLEYEAVSSFLYDEPDFYSKHEVFNLQPQVQITPEYYTKSNEQIAWSNNYFYKDNFLSFPIGINVTPYFQIDLNPFVGRNFQAMQKPKNHTNIVFLGGSNISPGDDFKFIFPTFATGSTGFSGEGWNINFRIGKEGLTIGNTRNGSIILNNTLESDCYTQAIFSTDYFAYSLDIIELQPQKTLYLHEIDLRLWGNTTVSFIEGSMPLSGFELRYLNPFMVMHSFGGWKEYGWAQDDEARYFGEMEANFCAYFAGMIESSPIKNSRIYLLYAQNEITGPGEPRYNPDSLGFQAGIDYSVPLANSSSIYTNGEIFYTSPFLYVKQKAATCMYNTKVESGFGNVTKSWVGLPWGPDCFGGSLMIGYKMGPKWNVELSYFLKEKGEIDIPWIESHNTTITGGKTVSYYYPTRTKDEYLRDTMKPTGIVEYTHRISLESEYNINRHFALNGKFLYSFVKNCNHILDNIQNGYELSLSGTYKVF